MNRRKPNILTTVALVLMVLAVLVCLVLFLTSRGKQEPAVEAPTLPTEQTEPSEPTEPVEDTEEPSEIEEPTQALSFDADGVQAKLDDSLDGLGSKWQVVVVDVASGQAVSSHINCEDDEQMIAADLPELFIMATVYSKLESGELTEDQVGTLLNEMMREDKDASSNELTKLLGGGDGAKGREEVVSFARSIGCEHVEFNRLFGEDGTENFITATDCATLLALIAKGECVSADASNKMQQLMSGVEGARIPAGAPSGATVAHLNANKGTDCCADAGIVTTDNGEYVLVIICNNTFDVGNATNKCVELTRLVSEFYQ